MSFAIFFYLQKVYEFSIFGRRCGDGSRRIERIVSQIAKRFEKSVFSETNESGLNINIRFEKDRINEKEKKNFVCCFFKMLRFKYQASF